MIKVKFKNYLYIASAASFFAAPAYAQDAQSEIEELKRQVAEMRADYEQRISQLEKKLDEAVELAEDAAIAQSAGSSSPSTFNPSIGAVLDGGFADVGPGRDVEPGFSPGEIEINLKANVDSRFYGNVTVGMHEHEGEVEVEVEEAWVQATSLPAGFSATAGKFFSSAGYLNSFHFHADDFVDRPLPYSEFFDDRYAIEGVRTRWVAPTNLLFELGGEFNWTEEDTSPGAWTAFTKLGGDLGTGSSWQIGLSHIRADAEEGSDTDSDLTVMDFVWKWAPQGNPTNNNFKIQGEYFEQSADLDSSGWYLQGVWQFAQFWRTGVRYDEVDAETDGNRSSVMLDWSPSEFSRFRLQYTNDKVLPEADDQWYLQYIMSIGAHGAHQF